MLSEARPAAFIDRDGVINEELGYVYRLEDFRLIHGAIEGLLTLQRAGYALVVITNQAGIARGLYSQDDFYRLTAHMTALLREQGVELIAVYFCPHHPESRIDAFAQPCDCRKPSPGMLLRAAEEHGLDLSRSVLVGDKSSDIEAGRAAGLERTVIVRSGHAVSESAAASADHVCADLASAARWLVR